MNNKLLVFVFAIAMIFTVSSMPVTINAQTTDLFEEKKIEQRLEFKAPVEIRISHNGWNGRNSPYRNSGSGYRSGQSPVLTAVFAEIVNNILGAPVAASTRGILDESRQRNAMVNDVWVDQSSARFTEHSQQPALYALVISTGGTSDGQRQSLRIGDIKVRGEFGSAEAVVTVGLIDLVTNTQVAGFVARSTRSSVNLEQIRINRSFHGYSLNNVVDWRLLETNHEYRREMLTIFQVLEDARNQFKSWVIPTKY